jgi:hypothetical protein
MCLSYEKMTKMAETLRPSQQSESSKKTMSMFVDDTPEVLESQTAFSSLHRIKLECA